MQLGVASPLTTGPRAGLQELEGNWPSTPLDAEQDPGLGPESLPFTVLQGKHKRRIRNSVQLDDALPKHINSRLQTQMWPKI